MFNISVNILLDLKQELVEESCKKSKYMLENLILTIIRKFIPGNIYIEVVEKQEAKGSYQVTEIIQQHRQIN